MTTRQNGQLLRVPGAGQPVTLLELFFDLAFVFALAQLSRALMQDLSWRGAYRTLILLFAVSWIWVLTAWLTDRLNPQRPTVQFVVLSTMVASMAIAATLPSAFGAHGLAFAITLVAVHLGLMVFLVSALPPPEIRTGQRLLFWSGLSAVPWMIGGLTGDLARPVSWSVAAALDYAAFALRYPTPVLGRVTVTDWPVVAEHLADRHRQLFIIALGELILVTGLTFSHGAFDAARTGAFGISMVATILLWRIYVSRVGELLDQAIAAQPDPLRLTRPVAAAHLVMVAGVIVVAVGDELVLTHPLGHTRPAWMAVLSGGPALFIVGRARLEHAVFGRVSPDRPVALLALLVLTAPLLFAPPLLHVAVVTAILAGVAIVDALRARGRPPEPPSPPGDPA